MTCIVGIQDRGSVWIGGDSAGVSGLDVTLRRDPKAFINHDFAIGYTTSFRMGQLLRFQFVPPKIPKGQDLYQYMVTHFVEAVRQCFKAGGFHDQDNKNHGGEFLVGYKDRLFTVDNDFQVAEDYPDYAAIGCGAKYALGCLSVQERLANQQARKRIEQALDVAAQFSGGVRPPYTIVKTP